MFAPSLGQIAVWLIEKCIVNAFFINSVGFLFRILLSGRRYHSNLRLIHGFLNWHANLHGWIAPFIDGAHWPVVLLTLLLYMVFYMVFMAVNLVF